MSRILTIRSILTQSTALAVLVLLLGGCSPSDEESNGQGPPKPAAEDDQPVVPGSISQDPAPEPDPPEANPPQPGTVAEPNPLRPPSENPIIDPPEPEPSESGPELDPPEPEDSEPFDPIAVNGPIFEDWPAQPKWALLITGRQDGYIEPCGCAGLDRMMGGMGRRHSLFRLLREKKGWDIAGLDVGGISKGFGSQATLKFQTMLNAMQVMKYDAITLGASELKLPVGDIVAEVVNGEAFFSANVGLLGAPGELVARVRILEVGETKIGVTGVLGAGYQKALQGDDIQLSDAKTAIKEVLPELKEKADYLVLLAHASVEESKELARAFPDFHLIVTAGGPATPPEKPEVLPSGAGLIEVGEKGMYAIVLAYFPGDTKPLRYQRVPLDSRFAASPDMKNLMNLYQGVLKETGFTGLGIPVGDMAPTHPAADLAGDFTGSKKCGVCHEVAYKKWKKSGHAHAYATLEKADPPRNFDPECISCHTVGWHPTQYFPYRGGFEEPTKTPHLTDVGCESCHGPGSAHTAAETTANDTALQQKLAHAMRITIAESQDHASGKQHCRSCHDLDNSPGFDFQTYWPKIVHSEDD